MVEYSVSRNITVDYNGLYYIDFIDMALGAFCDEERFYLNHHGHLLRDVLDLAITLAEIE